VTYKKREREKQNARGDDSCHFSRLSFCAKKKIPPLSREEKTQQTTSEKEKEKKRQNKQTTDFFFVRRKHTLHPFWRIHSFARKALALVLFFFVREEIRGVFSRRIF